MLCQDKPATILATAARQHISGKDRIRTAGATKDTIDCGAGSDFALIDSFDKHRRCDRAKRVEARAC